MKGIMYILRCANGEYYTGSTYDIELRMTQHNNGEGSNFTSKFLPIKLIYFEEFDTIAKAFRREKQIQGWSRKKKEALISGNIDRLRLLSKNYSQWRNLGFRRIDPGINSNVNPDNEEGAEGPSLTSNEPIVK